MLQPCAYAGNLDGQLAEVAATGDPAQPLGAAQAQSLVDLRDVADAAAVLLTEDGLDGGTFEAVGPEPLTAPRIAAADGGAARPRGDARWTPSRTDRSRPPGDYAARCLRLMFDHYRAHGFTGSPRVLEALLGRPARTYAAAPGVGRSYRAQSGELR